MKCTAALFRGLAGLGFFAMLVMAGSTAHAQSDSVSSSSLIGAGNGDFANILDSENAADGSYVSSSASQNFTGMDAAGDTETMNFTGASAASAEYGQLHCYATGTVTNTYYNAANPAYISDTSVLNPQGSPDFLWSTSGAAFTDTLQYADQNTGPTYYAKYIFHVEGTNTFTDYNTNTIAFLAVSIAGNAPEYFYANSEGSNVQDWVTQMYPINIGTQESINVQFSAQFLPYLENYSDGSMISGTSDFSETLSLAGIDIVDANGDTVSGVTVSSASGTNYNVVPEPASFAMILIPLAVLLLRHRTFRSPLSDIGSRSAW